MKDYTGDTYYGRGKRTPETRNEVLDRLTRRIEKGKSLRLDALKEEDIYVGSLFTPRKSRLPLFTSIVEAREELADRLEKEGKAYLAKQTRGYNTFVPHTTKRTFSINSLDEKYLFPQENSDLTQRENLADHTQYLFHERDALRPEAHALLQIDEEPLSREELTHAQQALSSYQGICMTLAHINRGLIVPILKRYGFALYRDGERKQIMGPNEDMLNMLHDSLLNAAVGFDRSQGVAFSTYATESMNNTIKEELARQKEKRIIMPTSSEKSIVDSLVDCAALPHKEREREDVTRRIVHTALNHLERRSHHVLTLRFGLEGHKPHTLDQVARIFGLSKERVRIIQNQSLKELREGPLAEDLSDLNSDA